ncbi:Trp biosynthesis-associated membrane protein [Leifsonia poae]|uniref:Trp biosynthesis-associated membrane protein n=1 Tax=Leifsonia poae TaxID=110933 RepID=UPI001CC12D72|nr:Trp biosynthesis-associated membrane protein [Leifsonia poae]
MTDATENEDEAQPERRVSRRAKYVTLLILLVGSGLTLLSSTQTWFSAQLTAVADHASSITVQGSAAAPALTALSLAGLALAAALAIAGPVFRIVLSLLGLLLGVSVLISSFSAIGDAVGASSAAITTATGVAGSKSVAALVISIHTDIWPAFAVAGGIALVLASAAVIVTSRLWPGPSRRYQTRLEDANGTGVNELFDADTAVEATDDAEARAAAEAAEHGVAPAEPATLDRDSAIDSWDDLSRGEDPTR